MKNIITLIVSLFVSISTFSIGLNSISISCNHINKLKDTIIKQQADSNKIILKQDTLKRPIAVKLSSDTFKTEAQQSKANNLDTIFKRNGDTILCTILQKDLFEVDFLKPKDKLKYKLNTVNIKALHYANGKFELVDNTPEKKKKDWTVATPEIEWKNITITYEPNDVAGLVEKGQIDAFVESKRFNIENETLEKNAYSILKKKASNLKAIAVLIVDKNISRMYGEMPNIKIKATAYGK